MKSDNDFLWIVVSIAAALGVMLYVTGSGLAPTDSSQRTVEGAVYELTASNLAVARRKASVLVALFTGADNVHGARMARGLALLAEQVKGKAIIAVGNTAEEPELVAKAGLKQLPAWIVYRAGNEVSRATGENSDRSVERFIAEQTGDR